MTDDSAVRADIRTVEEVGRAVRSYRDQSENVLAQAQKDLKQQIDLAHAEVRSRRQTFERARQFRIQAEMALARCREGCGPLIQQVGAAQRRERQSLQSLQRAESAVKTLEAAASAFGDAAREYQRLITFHGSAALQFCDELAAKLKHFIAGGIVVAKLVQAVAGADLPAALVASGAGESVDSHHAIEKLQEEWAEAKGKELEEGAGQIEHRQ